MYTYVMPRDSIGYMKLYIYIYIIVMLSVLMVEVEDLVWYLSLCHI